MNVQTKGVQLVTTESLGMRPISAAKSMVKAVVTFAVKVIVGDRHMREWARVERVDWYQRMEYGPAIPTWYGSHR